MTHDNPTHQPADFKKWWEGQHSSIRINADDRFIAFEAWKAALASMPRMTRFELISFLQTEGREASHINNFSLKQAVIVADSLLAKLPHITKENEHGK